MKAVAGVLGAIALAFLAAAGGYLLRDSQDLTQEWSHCVDTEAGFDVEYPADWHRGGTVSDPERAKLLCRFFDPEPFNIPPDSDFFGTALEVGPIEQPFDEALASLIDTRFNRTELREQLSLQGRHRAFRLELVGTGEGLAERGTRTYAYLIRRLDGPPVFVRTTAAPGEELVHRAVVDHAASTLVLFATPPAEVSGLPEPVQAKLAAILDAAERGDEDDVAALADPAGFEYTFGGPVPGGPSAYWRQIEATERPLEALAKILRMPYTLSRGVFVWPFAYDTTEDELTEYEREVLAPLGEGGVFADGYLGWRAGIEPDGRWIFFVAGD